LNKDHCSEDKLAKVREIGKIAEARGVSIAQLALLWVLRDERVTSALIGASSPKQIIENAAIAEMEPLTSSEIVEIERVLTK
jgi:L-glyceraldehyde 3-phosphate reductase